MITLNRKLTATGKVKSSPTEYTALFTRRRMSNIPLIRTTVRLVAALKLYRKINCIIKKVMGKNTASHNKSLVKIMC